VVGARFNPNPNSRLNMVKNDREAKFPFQLDRAPANGAMAAVSPPKPQWLVWASTYWAADLPLSTELTAEERIYVPRAQMVREILDRAVIPFAAIQCGAGKPEVGVREVGISERRRLP